MGMRVEMRVLGRAEIEMNKRYIARALSVRKHKMI